jgi:hypothetical protein
MSSDTLPQANIGPGLLIGDTQCEVQCYRQPVPTASNKGSVRPAAVLRNGRGPAVEQAMLQCRIAVGRSGITLQVMAFPCDRSR